ncbi:hypothetical protein KCU62_g9700, partial [Aureobasidium sp. EXF-3399]
MRPHPLTHSAVIAFSSTAAYSSEYSSFAIKHNTLVEVHKAANGWQDPAMPQGRPNELSRLQGQISDVTAVLSLIMKTTSGLQEQDGRTCQSERAFPENPEANHDTETEHLDEDDFDDLIVVKDAKDDAIKRKTLDRLAEIMARTKTARNNRMSRKRNADAKHVTSVILVEDLKDSKDKSATFIFSKNGGFDAVDESFLKRLEALLQNIASNGNLEFYLLSLYDCVANVSRSGQ